MCLSLHKQTKKLADVDNNSTTDIVAIGGYTYSDEGRIWVARTTETGFTFWSWEGDVGS